MRLTQLGVLGLAAMAQGYSNTKEGVVVEYNDGTVEYVPASEEYNFTSRHAPDDRNGNGSNDGSGSAEPPAFSGVVGVSGDPDKFFSDQWDGVDRQNGSNGIPVDANAATGIRCWFSSRNLTRRRKSIASCAGRRRKGLRGNSKSKK
jgi:hypothetical protein